jgi:hypothetical protein
MLEMSMARMLVLSPDAVADLLLHSQAPLVSPAEQDFPRVEELVRTIALVAEAIRQHLVAETWQIQE